MLGYRPAIKDDTPVITAIERHMASNPRDGFGLMYDTLSLAGLPCGKTRLWRVYCELKLNFKRRGKRRLPERVREPLDSSASPSDTWSADFMAQALWNGQRFRAFNVLDDYNREALRIEIDTSLPATRVVRALNELVEVRGKPARIGIDNGPEFISHELANSVIEHVGMLEKQKMFAKEVCRVGKRIWIQTPAKSFFFEPDYITPFIHWLPKHYQKKLLRNFSIWRLITRPTQKYIDDLVDQTRLLTFEEVKSLFPGCTVRRERFLFMTKAYLIVRT